MITSIACEDNYGEWGESDLQGGSQPTEPLDEPDAIDRLAEDTHLPTMRRGLWETYEHRAVNDVRRLFPSDLSRVGGGSHHHLGAQSVRK